MDRRLIVTALACWPATRVIAQDSVQRPRHKISAAQLHAALSQRFPVRMGLEGLLEIEVSAPGLLLLPRRNQLGATLQAQVSGLQLPQAQTGEVDVAFALRYEAADQTVRAHGLEVLGLRWPGLAPEALQLLQRVLPAMTRDAVGEVVLQKLSARELALADTMGFEPDKMTVVDDGLVISFGPKQRR
ncbi:MAG TPA: DUF1439 domain-containing protein [Ramlibacter sp.]|nr:DUF1439 domain-containing protein [Ramlibacter sp.]